MWETVWAYPQAAAGPELQETWSRSRRMDRSPSPKRSHVEHTGDYSDSNFYEIKELFNKRFTFKNPSDKPWCLSDIGEDQAGDSCHSAELQKLKESLNNVKNELGDKELAKWHQHTGFTNRAGKVISSVRRFMNAELCTQAWCKFHEILCTFSLLPEDKELNSVHLCEAPGAFIASLNHFLRTHYKTWKWKWVANTLNPYNEGNDTGTMIMDDRLIVDTLSCWYFGPDNTGDIMVYKYLEGLMKFTQHMKKIHLVTADGSFDCQDNPGEQEALVSPLHYCETITALKLLSPKGSFVLKLFTLFERSSVCLLYLLNCCFQQVHVFKPGTSKSGNSEVYAVCLNYAGTDALGDHLDQLELNFGLDVVQKAWFARAAVPDSFLKQLEECCTFFHKCQTETIRENIRLFGNMSEADNIEMEAKRRDAADFYLEKFKLRRVVRDDWVVKSHASTSLTNRHPAHKKKHSGSYNERQELAGLVWYERIRKSWLGSEVKQHCSPGHEAGYALMGRKLCGKYCDWPILKGRQLSRLATSPFCDVELLQNMVEAVRECRKANNEVVSHCTSCTLYSGDLVLQELTSLMKLKKESVHCGELVDCHVIGSSEVFSCLKQSSGLRLLHFKDVPPHSGQCTVLHDGEVEYQKWLLDVVFRVLEKCREGEALILPILSSFTRFTAGLIYLLHHCFRTLDFVCPTSSDALGTLAFLLCAGFRDPSREVLDFLKRLTEEVLPVSESEQSQQVLEFVPIEMLLRGDLMDFLSRLNRAIAKQRLHLLIQATI
ncbi:cap-specific mRNA (nucleoside-2'-O-)-methyltransferase 2 isoform X2 [Scyliorhinus canicula]|uniref:cap-specific mRNA (nucleoside-2'-O-)-methyltransferase 2 isoform X2 n=1 Tax=Scyliorhinus canicula TaxID=7830 RepID=UPI0018F57A1F|nr:cap-specific mRNA (nucleoside-2'-O-)-methyltransferase 2 isoform X2 [Scyliorhinus canicula]